ncbi:MAG: UDP-N-acetylmuramoyl-L-alanine--D-glutamate ligase [Candidatus Blackburnbacteria bacterium]|nr:UDP-N-acetylmuramoyl-L-alanine--D-glutamate ligase [Candidatus Blackburnbacteria bacterium]
MHYSKYKVAIVGFGVEGQDAARYFLGQESKKIVVFDRNPEESFNTGEYEKKGVEFFCGPDYLSLGLKDFDYIVRSPGVYRYLPEIVEAERSGVKIISNTQLFFEESEANIIGITGTKGKGTTARMLEAGLKSAGKKVLLLGNMGTPMLDRIDDADTFDWVILELSSFQLIDLPYSPPIAIVTNIKTDHLNWHKDREEYIHAKENLWKHQKSTDYVVFNRDDETCREFGRSAVGRVIWVGEGIDTDTDTDTERKRKGGVFVENGEVVVQVNEVVNVGKVADLKVPGQHNIANALGALVGGVLAGGNPSQVWGGISSFEGVEHRLEKVGEIDGVVYINDSAATTSEAAIAALRTFPNPKVLIAGGSLKGVGFKTLAQGILENNVKSVILMGESAKEIQIQIKKQKIKEGGNLKIIRGIEEMGEIVKKAKELARSGDIVLLSPGCASFGLFKDYKDRGDKFKEVVSREV